MFRKYAIFAVLLAALFSMGESHAVTQPPATSLIIGTRCNLPGAFASNRCTVLYHVRDNPANNIICVWNGNSLVACGGRTAWGGPMDYVTAAGSTVEIRHHTTWPVDDPAWPDAQAVRTKGLLLKSQFVSAVYRAAPTAACDVTVALDASIQAAVNTGQRTICLAAGIHPIASKIVMKANQTLRSASSTSLATIRPSQHIGAIQVAAANVTVKDLIIDSLPTARAAWSIEVIGTTNFLAQNVKIYRSLTGIAITDGAANVEIRDSQIVDAGDGLACHQCANPSVWVNDSANIRLVKLAITNNGVGPEGDGGIGCYNTLNLTLQNSSIVDTGASGLYMVNCDRAIVIGNLVKGSQEWGLDIVDTGATSGSDFGLYTWNEVSYSRSAGGVLLDSTYNTFTNNTYTQNMQGPDASGSCNGINRRGYTTGLYQFNDVADPWPVGCSD